VRCGPRVRGHDDAHQSLRQADPGLRRNRLADVEYTGDGQLVDAVISLRYPAFVVKHARHRMWLTHLLREYYDLWPSFSVQLGWRQRAKERARRAVIRYLDAHALARLDRRFVISKTVQTRLSRFLE